MIGGCCFEGSACRCCFYWILLGFFRSYWLRFSTWPTRIESFSGFLQSTCYVLRLRLAAFSVLSSPFFFLRSPCSVPEEKANASIKQTADGRTEKVF